MASKRRDFTEPLGTHGTEPEVEPLARSHSGASLLTTQLGGPSHPGEGGGGVSLKPSDPAAPMAADVVIDSQGSETAKFLQFLGPGILVAAVYVSSTPAPSCLPPKGYGLDEGARRQRGRG